MHDLYEISMVIRERTGALAQGLGERGRLFETGGMRSFLGDGSQRLVWV